MPTKTKRKNILINDFDKLSQDYMKDIIKYTSLTNDEEYSLWKRYKENNDIHARNKLITANLKFVTNVASKYKGRGLSYADLIAEGNMGLFKAADKFDARKGYRFITYSVWWIRQSILDALKKRNAMDVDEIPEETDYQNFSDEDVINDNDNCLMRDFISEDGMNEIYTNEQKEILSNLLSCLTEREKFVVSEYYGLTDESKTLEKIGKEIGLTKERVRQINNLAFKKLRTAALTLGIDETIYK